MNIMIRPLFWSTVDVESVSCNSRDFCLIPWLQRCSLTASTITWIASCPGG